MDSVREGVVYVPQLQSVVAVIQQRRLDFEFKLQQDSARGGTNCNLRLAGYYDTANTLIDAAQYLI